MGRFTPAWAFSLLAACVLLGLAFVDVAPARTPLPSSAEGPVARPGAVAARPAVAAVGGSAVRTAVAARSARTCRSGLIALTFDDGPSPAVTKKLVRTLVRLKVPATFFMIGSRVDANPALARLVQRSGFTIGNHTWNHPQLTHLSDAAIRQQLWATKKAFKRHHIQASRLMRPPYGDSNTRVRRVVHRLGMVPVLWTIDSRDWAGGTSTQIAHRILTGLRPHGTNLVLQHDGVDNSPASLAAVPIVVRKARERGYCFTRVNAAGGVGAGSAPRTATPILPASHTDGSGSTTVVRAAAAPTTTQVRAARRSNQRLLFASRKALRMPRSAYLGQLLAALSRQR